ncbi:hypothetical protein EOL96_08460 [Candidatus Saccharibacteria bacterium]|nr:hypothetical protein [Candidatus Saccharibacteria bacterium]
MTRNTGETIAKESTGGTVEVRTDKKHSLPERLGSSLLSVLLAVQPGVSEATADANSPEQVQSQPVAAEEYTVAGPDVEEPTALELAVADYKEAAFSYVEGAFVYSREEVPAVKYAKEKGEAGLPFAWTLPLSYRQDIDLEKLSGQEKITKFFELINEVYTKDPAAFAAVVLLMKSRIDGSELADAAIKDLADQYKNDPEKWQQAYEGFVGSLLKNPESLGTSYVGEADAGSLYETTEGRIVKVSVSMYPSETLEGDYVTYQVLDDGTLQEIACGVEIKDCSQPKIGPEDTCTLREIPPERPKTPFGTPYTPEKEPPVIYPQPLPPLVPPFAPPFAPVPRRPLDSPPFVPLVVRNDVLPTLVPPPERIYPGEKKKGRPRTLSTGKPRSHIVQPARKQKQPTFNNNGAGPGVSRYGRHRKTR